MANFIEIKAYKGRNNTKVKFRIPKWVENGDKDIYFIAGTISLAIFKREENFWYIKKTPCSYCGECCHDPKRYTNIYPTDNDRCVQLWINRPYSGGLNCCQVQASRPLSCVVRPEPGDLENLENCSITFEKNGSPGLDIVFQLPAWHTWHWLMPKTMPYPLEMYHGRESFATFTNEHRKWKIKKVRCNFCGQCCFLEGEGDAGFGHPVINGHCAFLRESDGVCTSPDPLISCMTDPTEYAVRTQNCCIEHKDEDNLL